MGERILFEKWQVKVILEKEDLEAKISKLGNFILSDDFKKVSPQEHIRLKMQLSCMNYYYDVLRDRINAFE